MATATKTTRPECETAWSGWVQTFPDPTDPERRGCAIGVYGKTIPELIQSIYRGATYYHALGYRCVGERITRDCVACYGQGTRGRRMARTGEVRHERCKACRGKGTFESMPDFELTPSECITLQLK